MCTVRFGLALDNRVGSCITTATFGGLLSFRVLSIALFSQAALVLYQAICSHGYSQMVTCDLLDLNNVRFPGWRASHLKEEYHSVRISVLFL